MLEGYDSSLGKGFGYWLGWVIGFCILVIIIVLVVRIVKQKHKSKRALKKPAFEVLNDSSARIEKKKNSSIIHIL